MFNSAKRYRILRRLYTGRHTVGNKRRYRRRRMNNVDATVTLYLQAGATNWDSESAWNTNSAGTGISYTNPQNFGNTEFICNLNGQNCIANVDITVKQITSSNTSGYLSIMSNINISSLITHNSASTSGMLRITSGTTTLTTNGSGTAVTQSTGAGYAIVLSSDAGLIINNSSLTAINNTIANGVGVYSTSTGDIEVNGDLVSTFAGRTIVVNSNSNLTINGNVTSGNSSATSIQIDSNCSCVINGNVVFSGTNTSGFITVNSSASLVINGQVSISSSGYAVVHNSNGSISVNAGSGNTALTHTSSGRCVSLQNNSNYTCSIIGNIVAAGTGSGLYIAGDSINVEVTGNITGADGSYYSSIYAHACNTLTINGNIVSSNSNTVIGLVHVINGGCNNLVINGSLTNNAAGTALYWQGLSPATCEINAGTGNTAISSASSGYALYINNSLGTAGPVTITGNVLTTSSGYAIYNNTANTTIINGNVSSSGIGRNAFRSVGSAAFDLTINGDVTCDSTSTTALLYFSGTGSSSTINGRVYCINTGVAITLGNGTCTINNSGNVALSQSSTGNAITTATISSSGTFNIIGDVTNSSSGTAINITHNLVFNITGNISNTGSGVCLNTNHSSAIVNIVGNISNSVGFPSITNRLGTTNWVGSSTLAANTECYINILGGTFAISNSSNKLSHLCGGSLIFVKSSTATLTTSAAAGTASFVRTGVYGNICCIGQDISSLVSGPTLPDVENVLDDTDYGYLGSELTGTLITNSSEYGSAYLV